MRLTKEIKKNIVASAMMAAFKARDSAHEKSTADLADAVYENEFGESEKIANKLPQGWCSVSAYVYISAAGYTDRYYRLDEKKPNGLKMSKERRLPLHHSSNPIKIGGAHHLNDKAQDLADEYITLLQDKDILRAKLQAIVEPHYTVKKMLELWPEGEKFLPKSAADAAKPKNQLVPVGMIEEVNSLLGIKPKARTANKKTNTQ